MLSRFFLSNIILLLAVQTCFAEGETDVHPVVKPFLMSYTQMRADLRRDTVIFKQEKLIFGLDFKLNENWSARVGVDLIRMNKPYLKPTVITYRKNRWTIDGGIFTTSEMDLSMTRFWNNRFIDRVAADGWLHDPTADLGVRVAYRWNDFVTTDVSLVSGNGYQHLLEKYHPKPAFRIILSPVRPLEFGGYFSARKDGITETTINGFANLQLDNRWKVTGEFHHQANCRFVQGCRMDVFSAYATYNILKWMGLMGRYDIVWSNRMNASDETWNAQEDGHTLIGGLIFQCFPSVRLSVNYWNKRPVAQRVENEDWLYVCLEFKY